MISPRASTLLFFGDTVQNETVDRWCAGGKKQPVGQAEIWPVLAAKRTWRNLLAHARVLWFLDNESAREALVKSYSPVDASREILWMVAKEEAVTPTLSWFARVPTLSNPADDPSRLEFGPLLKAGAVAALADQPSLRELLQAGG